MSLDSEKPPKASHFNDWPNSIGFDVRYEERAPVELKIEGNIPDYAAGVLFRTGLGPRTIETESNGTFKTNHWFDSFGQVHRFQILASNQENPTRVIYNSRLTTDGLIEKVRKTGRLNNITFAAKYEPCKTFFQKLHSTFTPTNTERAPNEANVGVTISVNLPGMSKTGEKIEAGHSKDSISTLCTKTDAAPLQMLDPETLEPIGLASQETLHPELKGALSGAHAKSDPITGDVYNYNLDLKKTGTYRVFSVSASTGETSILASFSENPAYLHSISLSGNYVIVCLWNAFYKSGGLSILWNQNLLDSMAWNPKIPTAWYVIDKKPPKDGGRGVVAVYESDPFFCFHTVNAFEEKSKDGSDSMDLVVDLIAYESMECIKRFYLDNIMSDSPAAQKRSETSYASVSPNYRRFRLPSIPKTTSKTRLKAVSEFSSRKEDAPELPVVNPHYFTKAQRYVYGINDSGKSSFMDSLIKYDTATHTIKRWSVHGHTAGEPIFVADPSSSAEDGGVLLSVVLDGIAGKSYLLVLNAQTMEEVGKAHVDGVVGFGFHGVHVKSSADVTGANRLDF